MTQGPLVVSRRGAALRRHGRALRRSGYGNPMLILGVVIILALFLGSFIVPATSKWAPEVPFPHDALQGPSLSHPFGTDLNGLDVFVRVFYAPRVDFYIAFAGVSLGFVVGTLIGLFAGFSRTFLGDIVLRITDVVQAFPLLILAIALVSLSGNKLSNVIWAIAFLNVPIFLRLIRSRVLTIREQRFVEAAIALGNPKWRVVIKHILPNSIAPVIVQYGLSLGFAILTVGALAFLGIGVQMPTPEWGSMIQIGRSNITTGQWWTVLFPGLFLGFAVAGFNLIAEGIDRAREIYKR